MGTALHKTTGVLLFLLALAMVFGFLLEAEQIFKTAVFVILLLILFLAILITAGVFYIRTNETKSGLLDASSWLIIVSFSLYVLIIIASYIQFAASRETDTLGIGILFALTTWLMGIIVVISLILLVIYLYSRKSVSP